MSEPDDWIWEQIMDDKRQSELDFIAKDREYLKAEMERVEKREAEIGRKNKQASAEGVAVIKENAAEMLERRQTAANEKWKANVDAFKIVVAKAVIWDEICLRRADKDENGRDKDPEYIDSTEEDRLMTHAAGYLARHLKKPSIK